MLLDEPDSPPAPRGLFALKEAFERVLILAALEAAGGHQRRAATYLGVLPTTLNEKLKRLQLVGYARALSENEEECPTCGARRPNLAQLRAALRPEGEIEPVEPLKSHGNGRHDAWTPARAVVSGKPRPPAVDTTPPAGKTRRRRP